MGQLFGSCIHHALALPNTKIPLMIAMVTATFVTTLVLFPRLELLLPTHLGRATIRAIPLAPIMTAT